MKRLTVSALGAVWGLGCGGPQTQSSTLGAAPSAKAETIPKHTMNQAQDNEAQTIQKIGEMSKALGMPTVGFVRGYYTLPLANPARINSFESGQIAGLPYNQNIVVQEKNRGFALTPANSSELDAMQGVVNDLLQAGLKLVEVSMADAQKVLEAERAAVDAGRFVPNTLVDSGVDYLISVQRGDGFAGDILAGRVILTDDGSWLALKTTPNVGPISMRPLILELLSTAFSTAQSRAMP